MGFQLISFPEENVTFLKRYSENWYSPAPRFGVGWKNSSEQPFPYWKVSLFFHRLRAGNKITILTSGFEKATIAQEARAKSIHSRNEAWSAYLHKHKLASPNTRPKILRQRQKIGHQYFPDRESPHRLAAIICASWWVWMQSVTLLISERINDHQQTQIQEDVLCSSKCITTNKKDPNRK